MSDLMEWLEEQITADELTATRAADFHLRRIQQHGGTWATGSQDPMMRHNEQWDPRRVLAECKAKRAIIAFVLPELGMYETEFMARETLRLLAQVYVDRPGFDPIWRERQWYS